MATLALAGALLLPALGADASEAPAAPGTSVEMPTIISPMNDADGRLTGYAYITATLVASSPDVAVAIRNKTPFIQDAFVRDVNDESITSASDPSEVDKSGVAARFLADARKIMGAGKVVSLDITQIQKGALMATLPSDRAPPAQNESGRTSADAAPQQAGPVPAAAKSGS